MQQVKVLRTIEVADTVPAPAPVSGVRGRGLEAEQAPPVPITAPPPSSRPTQALPLGHEQLFRFQSRKLLNQSTLGRYRLVSPEWQAKSGGVASRKY